MTIRQRFFIHNLMNKVKRYIKACHTCFKTKPKYKKNRSVYGRIPIDYAPMQDLSIDIKHMSMAFGGYQYLLVIACDQTNFTIVIPLRSRDIQSVAKALIYRVTYLFGTPRQIKLLHTIYNCGMHSKVTSYFARICKDACHESGIVTIYVIFVP